MTTPEQHQQNLQRLQRLRPIDDDFMRCLLKDNIPLAQLILRIITNKPDLTITHCQTQKDLKRLAGARSICLDAHAIDAQGKHYDLEIQRADKGASPHRARYHASVLDIENLNTQQPFNQLPDTYIIFITEKDPYHANQPIYPIQRINLATNTPFNDGQHILYVNAQYRDNTDLGKLMHDLNCTNPDHMYHHLLAQRTRYLKQNPKGVTQMCQIMEEMKKEAATEKAIQIAQRMLKTGKYAPEEIADIAGLPLNEIIKLQNPPK